ncbi:hypothetical protein [Sphingomonas sp. LHG3406-1]|uniref:hypothetical protein n=1 Tax=Sphingomonas sp. LHG3406-1 TaxID=2804617 RepID=UPI00261896BF|nr:hypothetical protein [Sphingomonas sp. LHG3406-1]
MPALMFLAALAVQAVEPAQAATRPAKEDKIVCTRRPQASLGSNIAAKRVCKKQSELDEEARLAKRNLQKFQDHRSDPYVVPGGQPIPQ